MGNKSKKNRSTSQKPSQQEPLAKTEQNSSKEMVTHARADFFQGPIPPPAILAEYDNIIPNGAERILKMAEDQSAHRQNLEKWAVKSGALLSHLGVLCALVIALFALRRGSDLILAGYVMSGSIFAGSGLIGIVTAFIYGTRSRREERRQKYGQKEGPVQEG